ncbi:MAG TPA: MFS transporter [Candidatus Corynebacterium gallistercoris]|uniref:MFS transporter n=1 Tax=Candidatus Corynebacterium gallistercoris TaxID=2838530 RepID=A0A9D1UQ15_9CORY|nr:MFS transporter [Candidatus Corynebacterium gallistercoris]
MLAAASGYTQLEVSVISFFLLLPWLAGPFAGTWIDRYGPAFTIFWAALARATFLLLAALVVSIDGADDYTFVIWIVSAFISGCCDMSTDVASISRVNELSKSGRGSVTEFSRLAIVQTLFGNLLAPSAAGILVAAPQSMSFCLLGSLSVLSIAALRRQPVVHVTPTKDHAFKRSIIRDSFRGFRVIQGNAWLTRTMLTVSLFNIASAASSSVALVYYVQQLGVPAGTVGVSFMLVGVASVIGGYIAPFISSRFGFKVSVIIGITGILGTLFSPIISSEFMVIIGTMSFFSLLSPIFGANMISKRQDVTPVESLGSVNGAFQFAEIGISPLGSLMGGLFATFFGSTAVLCTVPFIGLTACLIFRPWSLPVESDGLSEGSV